MHLRPSSPFRLAALRALLCAALIAVDLPATATDAASAAASAAVPAGPVGPIDVDDIVLDRSQVEWSEAYLQWIAAFARDSSPVSDTTGAQCGARQEGDVWFLATSDGTEPIVRTCSVPAGKTLFVPIASTTERSGNKEPDCASMARLASGTLTHLSQLRMTLDGQPVEDLRSHRVATGDCFALGARQTPRSTARTAVADGYYLMFAPLPAGPHTIVVDARFDDTLLSTTYRLDVR